MKYIWKTKIFLTALIAISAFVQAGNAQTNRTVQVRFKQGDTSASYNDRIRGYGGIDYVLRADEGQKLAVEITSSNRFLYFTVLDQTTKMMIDTNPAPAEVTKWEGIVPKTGDYIIRVYLVRAEARRNRDAPFSIMIEALAKGESSLEPSEVEYNCKGSVRLTATFIQGDSGSVKLKSGKDAWNLEQVQSGSGAKYSNGLITFWTKGEEAIFERGGRSYNCAQTEMKK